MTMASKNNALATIVTTITNTGDILRGALALLSSVKATRNKPQQPQPPPPPLILPEH